MYPVPKLHNYTKRFKGHDYIWKPDNSGMTGTALGFGYGLKVNDYILLEAENSGAPYRIVAVRYYSDPADMWRAELRYVNAEELKEVSRLFAEVGYGT